MKKFDITKLHENFTDESNSVILLDNFLNSIKDLSLEEQNLLMKEVLNLSSKYNKLYEKEIKESEKFYNNRTVNSKEKRKVVSTKKVSKERKKYIMI